MESDRAKRAHGGVKNEKFADIVLIYAGSERSELASVQHLVASVASQGRFPVATGLSLCLYLNCAPEAGKESSGSLGLFLAFAAGVAAVPPPSPDA